MKMQSLGVLFVIIILPVFIAVSLYINMQIDTVSLQTKYDAKLHNATHDAIKAFQINETNSNTQNIATEKIRDIEASIETFFNSLAMSLGLDAFGEDELSPYVPALAYTLYDGYYIYSAFNNVSSGTPKYERGLKPFIYYSARYTTGGIDVTVNYTLDNYITVYGYINGEYVTKSGYLINPNDFNDHGSTITYKGLTIGEEELKETIMYQTTNSSVYSTEDNQIFVYKETENNQREKVYRDNGSDLWYRISVDRRKIQLTREVPASTYDNSAVLYYKKAAAFSKWINDNLSGIKLKDTVGYDATLANDNPEANAYYINSDMAEKNIFDLTNSNNDPDSNNDPEDEKSTFNEHRRNIIKYTVQTNLNAAIAGYNSISQVNDTTYNFKMPVLKETDWDKILNNVSLISFMQGLPIKNAYYNGYSIVTNNKNREFVDPDFIYFSTTGNTYDNSVEYHTIYDEDALKNLATSNNIIGYRNLDFERQRMYDSEAKILTEGYKDTGITSKYYYKHAQSACYNCIITNFVRNDNSKYTDGELPASLSQYLGKLVTRR